MNNLPVVLLAHGRQERLLSIPHPKQFLEVNGEPILYRTVRLLEERKIVPSLVVAPKTAPWAAFSGVTGIRRLAFDGQAPSIACVVAHVLRSEFPQGALFLLSDVVFSRPAVSQILSNGNPLVFFGKPGPNPWTKKGHDETYAFRCNEAAKSLVVEAVLRERPDLPWKLRDLRLYLKLLHYEIPDWTDDVDDDRDLAIGLPLLSGYAKLEGATS